MGGSPQRREIFNWNSQSYAHRHMHRYMQRKMRLNTIKCIDSLRCVMGETSFLPQSCKGCGWQNQFCFYCIAASELLAFLEMKKGSDSSKKMESISNSNLLLPWIWQHCSSAHCTEQCDCVLHDSVETMYLHKVEMHFKANILMESRPRKCAQAN